VIGFNATFSVAKNCDESVGKIDELASTLGSVATISRLDREDLKVKQEYVIT